MNYHERLKAARIQKGKTQREAAMALGISRQGYAIYERGERALPTVHYITLAKYYNITLDYFCGFTDEPKRLYEEADGSES